MLPHLSPSKPETLLQCRIDAVFCVEWTTYFFAEIGAVDQIMVESALVDASVERRSRDASN
jgi:hypothetical protein